MRLAAPLLLLAAWLGACGGDEVSLPDGVTLNVEQTRQDLPGRRFQVQVVNAGRADLTVEHVELESARLDRPVGYDGPTLIAAGTTVNLTMTMPRARCGDGVGARVRVTYSVDGGEVVTSVGHPRDRYGSVERFMTRDCAERAVGRLSIDRLTVRGDGDEATLRVDVTFTPPTSGAVVRLVAVDGSTLLAPAGPDATTIDRELRPGGEPVSAGLTFIPNRCDVHVVAEDRTGGILPLRVESQTFGTSPVYLRFTAPQQAQIFDYLAERCGFGTEQDSRNAP